VPAGAGAGTRVSEKVVGGQNPRLGSISGPSAPRSTSRLHRALAKQELRERGLKWIKVNCHDRLVKDENAGKWARRVAKAQKPDSAPRGVSGPKVPQKSSVSEGPKTGFSVRKVAGGRK